VVEFEPDAPQTAACAPDLENHARGALPVAALCRSERITHPVSVDAGIIAAAAAATPCQDDEWLGAAITDTVAAGALPALTRKVTSTDCGCKCGLTYLRICNDCAANMKTGVIEARAALFLRDS
jgi:hypothetical protein